MGAGHSTAQGSSEITHDDMKWIRGLRWEEIDQNWILRHTINGGKDIITDLRQKPMVMDELAKRAGARPPSGPVIVSEHTELLGRLLNSADSGAS